MNDCEIEGCTKKAKFGMYRTIDGKKEWLHVCKECERDIARENLIRAGVLVKKNGHGRYNYKKR